jgi:hypothetical protein
MDAGHDTLKDVENDCREVATQLKLDIKFCQSNREYEIVDWIHEARETAAGIVIIRRHLRTRLSPSRRLEYVRGSGYRDSHFQRTRARGLSASFLYLVVPMA